MVDKISKFICFVIISFLTISCGKSENKDENQGKNLFSIWDTSFNKDTGKKINTGVIELNLSKNDFNYSETFAIIASVTSYDRTVCAISADIVGNQGSGSIKNISKSILSVEDFVNIFRTFYFEDPVAATKVLKSAKSVAICHAVLFKSNYNYTKSNDVLTLCPVTSTSPADCYYFK
ncbi:hypothetical protein QEJ31_14255 [Pigmentibacter sp. JX0631]|uniref:hypothetical protein n=1 Tax=Pigmentibacter sp. JX0631 TaxID=2976982 RepID=UPI0024690D60|nr:hypothetical protein [Pigmentibacter sp. JX0631]WGL59691.1 hypothetical protein QEJ31_14255 [Pigmentibacter sp. JX0631]